jgi:hypothetical protein
MSDDDLKAELERLRQENAELKKGGTSGLRLKVSEKGGVSLYGMGRSAIHVIPCEKWRSCKVPGTLNSCNNRKRFSPMDVDALREKRRLL